MKKYRVGYGFPIISQPFEFEGNLVLSLTVDVLYKIFDENGKEAFFKSEDLKKQQFDFGNGKVDYLPNLVRFSFDAENGEITAWNTDKAQNLNGYTIQTEIKRYYKDVCVEFNEKFSIPIAEGFEISKDEFVQIIKKNNHCFDSDNNLEDVSYFTEEIAESEACLKL